VLSAGFLVFVCNVGVLVTFLVIFSVCSLFFFVFVLCISLFLCVLTLCCCCFVRVFSLCYFVVIVVCSVPKQKSKYNNDKKKKKKTCKTLHKHRDNKKEIVHCSCLFWNIVDVSCMLSNVYLVFVLHRIVSRRILGILGIF